MSDEYYLPPICSRCKHLHRDDEPCKEILIKMSEPSELEDIQKEIHKLRCLEADLLKKKEQSKHGEWIDTIKNKAYFSEDNIKYYITRREVRFMISWRDAMGIPENTEIVDGPLVYEYYGRFDEDGYEHWGKVYKADASHLTPEDIKLLGPLGAKLAESLNEYRENLIADILQINRTKKLFGI